MPAKRQKITFEDIVECFKYKETEAAQRLGISKTKLKRLCRQYGTPRWPFRRIKSIERDIQAVESKLEKCSDGIYQIRYLNNKLKQLQLAKRFILYHPKIITMESNETIISWFERLDRISIPNLLNPEEDVQNSLVIYTNNTPL